MSFAEILYRIQRDPRYFASAALTVAGLVLSACGGDPKAYAQLPTRATTSALIPAPGVEQAGVSGDPENPDSWLEELERKSEQLNTQTQYTYAGDLYRDVSMALGQEGNAGRDIFASIDGYVSELRTLTNNQNEEWVVKRSLETFTSPEGTFPNVLKISISEKASGNDEIYETYEVFVVEDDTDPDTVENTSFITRSQFIDEMLPKLREKTGIDFDDLSVLAESQSLKIISSIASNPGAYLAQQGIDITDTVIEISPTGVLSMKAITSDSMAIFLNIDPKGNQAEELIGVIQFDFESPKEQLPQPDNGTSQA